MENLQNLTTLTFNRDIKFNLLRYTGETAKTNLVDTKFGFTIEPGCEGFELESQIEYFQRGVNIFEGQFQSFIRRSGHEDFILRIKDDLDSSRPRPDPGECPVDEK